VDGALNVEEEEVTETDLTDFDEFHGTVFVDLGDVALGFGEEVGGDEADAGGGGDDGEESGGVHEGIDREEGDAADVAVSTYHAGDLAGHATFDEGDHGEDGAFARLHEEGAAHGGDDGGGDGPGGRDLSESEVSGGQSNEEEDHGFASAEFIREVSTAGAGGEVHEGESGGEEAGGDGAEVEGFSEEGGEHGDDCEFGAEGDEVVDVEDGDLSEGVALVFGDVAFFEHLGVDAVDTPRLEDEDDGEG